MAIDLSKTQKLDVDPKAIKGINLIGNFKSNAAIAFIVEKAKESVLDFSKGTVKVLEFYFVLI